MGRTSNQIYIASDGRWQMQSNVDEDDGEAEEGGEYDDIVDR